MTRTTRVEIQMTIEHDLDADPNDYLSQDPAYCGEDQIRLDAWRNDEWHFVAIRAKARIAIPYGTNPACIITTELRSPGLWGIESDAGDKYFERVFQDEREILIDMLASFKTFEITEHPEEARSG